MEKYLRNSLEYKVANPITKTRSLMKKTLSLSWLALERFSKMESKIMGLLDRVGSVVEIYRDFYIED